jgi:pimeloyl-ACP methyl ester carboxylesterase
MRHRLFFKNATLDFNFQSFTLGTQTFGGAALGEAYVAARSIDESKPETWSDSWIELASRVEAVGRTALARQHSVSAREAFLRAYTYYRTATILMRLRHPALRDVVARAHTCFAQFATLSSPPIEPLHIELPGGGLDGYFMRPSGDARRRPTVIVVGGGETFLPDLYFYGGASAIERGYNAVLVDLPGQGRNMLDGIVQRPDTEAPVSAIVDALTRRTDVDSSRIALCGWSWGGYMVTRAAAYEKRIRALVASSPVANLGLITSAFPNVVAEDPRFGDAPIEALATLFDPVQLVIYEKFFEGQLGQPALRKAFAALKSWKVDPKQISCPTLCLVSASEAPLLIEHAREVYEALECPKLLHIFSEEEGADNHCQSNNLRFAQSVIFDWLDETLRLDEAL